MEIKTSGIFMLLILFMGTVGFAQQKIVTGTVTDENSVPLPGVNVIIEGTSQGTNTDFDGQYSLEVAEGQNLIFSSVGFKDQKVAVGSGSTLDVVMEEGTALDEVFVVAYGTATKESYTGSASVVQSQDIQDLPVASFQDALVGKAPGVNITKGSGQAGSTTSIQIRGIGSMNASTQPLYVVDGIPVTSGSTGQLSGEILVTNNIMNTLNPDDIALKDFEKPA